MFLIHPAIFSFLFYFAPVMESELISRQEFKGVPSASGIEIANSINYAIGDNSPCLFVLDNSYEVKEKIQITSSKDAVDGIIPKATKPDYEALMSATVGNDDVILVFGSGSKSPSRDSMALIHTTTRKVENYSLASFYNAIKSAAGITQKQFNLEGAAANGNVLYLFNRGNNTIIECALNELLNHLQKQEKCPVPKIYRIKLPSSDKLQAGFSGATVAGNKIVFTASVENTANWIDDGEIMGSYVGIIDLKDLKDNYSPACTAIKEKQKILSIKVESVAVTAIHDNYLELVLVTDSDGGVSEILKLRLSY